MTKDIYWNMVDRAQSVITEHFKLDPERVHLVSGGAAWAGTFAKKKSHAPLDIFLLNTLQIMLQSHCSCKERQLL